MVKYQKFYLCSNCSLIFYDEKEKKDHAKKGCFAVVESAADPKVNFLWGLGLAPTKVAELANFQQSKSTRTRSESNTRHSNNKLLKNECKKHFNPGPLTKLTNEEHMKLLKPLALRLKVAKKMSILVEPSVQDLFHDNCLNMYHKNGKKKIVEHSGKRRRMVYSKRFTHNKLLFDFINHILLRKNGL